MPPPPRSLAVQLDDRAMLAQTLAGASARSAHARRRGVPPGRAELAAVAQWGDMLDDSAAYPSSVAAGGVAGGCGSVFDLPEPGRSSNFPVNTRPAGSGRQRPRISHARLLTWDDLFLKAADDVRSGRIRRVPLRRLTWVAQHHPHQHPLAGFSGSAGAPDRHAASPLPGDRDMPRIQGPDFGASERFGRRAGHEKKLFHMPGASGPSAFAYYRADTRLGAGRPTRSCREGADTCGWSRRRPVGLGLHVLRHRRCRRPHQVIFRRST